MDRRCYIYTTKLVSLVLFWIPESTLAQIVKTPDNIATIQGSTIQINCTVLNSTTRWYHTNDDACLSDSTCSTSLIFGGYSSLGIKPDFQGRYSIHSSGGSQNLIITGTQLNDAGYLACVGVPDLNILHSIAWLIILETTPTCSDSDSFSVMEGEMTSVSCTVNFQGTLSPVMSFQLSNGNIKGLTTNTTIMNQTATYMYSINATRDMDGQTINCYTYFIPPPTIPNYSTTIPSYTSTVPCPILKVTYCPMCNNTVKIVNLGEDIHCYTSSNPVANYIWTDGSGSRLSTMSVLSADKLTIGSQYLCTVCSPCLTDGSSFCCNQTFEAGNRTTSSFVIAGTSAAIIGGVLGGVLGGVVLIIVIILIVILIRYKRSKTINSDRELKESTYTTLDVNRVDPSVYAGLERPYEIVT